jgi:hypothetical protein
MIARANGRTVRKPRLFARVVAGASARSTFSFYQLHAGGESLSALFPAGERSKFLAYAKRQ